MLTLLPKVAEKATRDSLEPASPPFGDALDQHPNRPRSSKIIVRSFVVDMPREKEYAGLGGDETSALCARYAFATPEVSPMRKLFTGRCSIIKAL